MKYLTICITLGLIVTAICVAQGQSTRLQVEGSFATAITTTTSDLTLNETHQIVLVNSSSTKTIALPSAIGIAGRK